MLKAYLVPHPPLLIPGVGRGDEIPATRQAYEGIAQEIREDAPETLIIISSHSVLYQDYFHIAPGQGASGSFARFMTGQIAASVRYDTDFVASLCNLARKADFPAGTLGQQEPDLDHGVLVPLYFLDCGAKIVRVSISGLSFYDHYRMGFFLSQAARSLSRKVVIIASGDMSHKLTAEGPYGYAPEAAEHDAFVRSCVEDADFIRLLDLDPALCRKAAECGTRCLIMLGGALDGLKVKSTLLAYEGPYGVGYLTASFEGDGAAPSQLLALRARDQQNSSVLRIAENVYVSLARANVESYVRNRICIPLPQNLPQEMNQGRAGVFVSIKKNGTLRGCIGTIAPTTPSIAEEILRNSIAAAVDDPRFAPIAPSELDELSYSVDLLSPPEPIDSPTQLDPQRYGVIVSSKKRRGLLLPRLEGVDTVEEQLSIALRKAGIRDDEAYALERFEVVRHE